MKFGSFKNLLKKAGQEGEVKLFPIANGESKGRGRESACLAKMLTCRSSRGGSRSPPNSPWLCRSMILVFVLSSFRRSKTLAVHVLLMARITNINIGTSGVDASGLLPMCDRLHCRGFMSCNGKSHDRLPSTDCQPTAISDYLLVVVVEPRLPPLLLKLPGTFNHDRLYSSRKCSRILRSGGRYIQPVWC